MKVAFTDMGFFDLNDKAIQLYEELSGKKYPGDEEVCRHDPYLIKTIESLNYYGASTMHSNIKVREIPDNKYHIQKYVGIDYDSPCCEVVICPSDLKWIEG